MQQTFWPKNGWRSHAKASAPCSAPQQTVQQASAVLAYGARKSPCPRHDASMQARTRHTIVPQAVKTARKPVSPAAAVLDEEPQDYDASSIQVLEGLEPVRKRPGMYIGSTGQGGLHHLVYEVLDNCIDEVQGGHATRVEMVLDLVTGWVTVTDDGRGIPTDVHPRTGKSALETVLTVLHAGGKFGGEASGYSVSGGLHGVGVSVVNALSERTEVRVWRNGRMYYQAFARGQPLAPLEEQEAAPEDEGRRGTQVRFLYDRTIFSSDAQYDPDTLKARLRELAFLNSSATILIKVIAPQRGRKRASSHAATPEPAQQDAVDVMEGEGLQGNGAQHVCPWTLGEPLLDGTASGVVGSAKAKGGAKGGGKRKAEAVREGGLDGAWVAEGWQAYHFQGGLREFVSAMTEGNAVLHDVLYFSSHVEGVGVEVALQWCADGFNDTLVGFANSIRTVDGGMHLDGTRAALTRTINALAKKLKLVKDSDPSLSGDCIREGLMGCVSVKVPNPEFEGQTKTRLGNPEVKRILDAAVSQALGEWLELQPAALSAIVNKALTAAKAADAAKRARELVRRKAVLTRTTLPGKLADCTSTRRANTEIFVVEGDSAGGSAKQARDRYTQAILPLRGKILNVERCDESSMLKNQEISNLIVALGLGSKDQGVEGLRYGKVVILTDADVDGAHIRTLLLTFLFRYRRELFDHGHVYVAVPPLYKVEEQQGKGKGPKVTWCYNDAEKDKITSDKAPGSFSIQRFKGLGEMMPQQLWETTLDPSKRTLRRLTIRDAAEASHMFSVLMGNKVGPRRDLIQERGSQLTLSDLDI